MYHVLYHAPKRKAEHKSLAFESRPTRHHRRRLGGLVVLDLIFGLDVDRLFTHTLRNKLLQFTVSVFRLTSP